MDFSVILDERLRRAIRKMGITSPTPIQEQVIRSFHDRRDLIANGPTGSGKTLAYLLPLLDRTLRNTSIITVSLVVVPTHELVSQVERVLNELLIFCGNNISVMNLADVLSGAARTISEKSRILIATPTSLKDYLARCKCLTADNLVIDEADLLFSFGYSDDLKKAFQLIDNVSQTIVISATMPQEVLQYFSKFLRDPVIVEMKSETDKVCNLYTECASKDKMLVLYVLLRLKIVEGRCIIFLKCSNDCYKLRIFLSQFGIKTCILTHELPQNTRFHIVEDFNRGVFDYMIASTFATANVKERDMQVPQEYCPTRGLDFKNVSAVINLDLPETADLYSHQVGRTGRGSCHGIAFNIVGIDSFHEREVLNTLKKSVNMKCVNLPNDVCSAFRYRCEDALNTVSKNAIKSARLAELKKEILNSAKLNAHFGKDATSLSTLRHGLVSRTTSVKPHLKHVPIYMDPRAKSQKAVGARPHFGLKLGHAKKRNVLKKIRSSMK